MAATVGERVARQSLPADVRFKPTPGSRWAAEGADLSCESASRVKQVKSPAAGQARLPDPPQEGDDSYGERCELGMANASSSAIDRVGGSRVLFQNGTESWIAQQIMLDRDEYAFCGTSARWTTTAGSCSS